MPKELPSWPYDWQTAESRLDPDIIASQGEFMLHRALNTRRLIAFVGSGVSAAYGRVTWTELALFHIDHLIRFFPRGKIPDTNGFPAEDPRHNLWNQLRALQKEGRAMGETVLLALQLCEQMWCLTPNGGDRDKNLDHLAQLFQLKSKYNRLHDLGVRQPQLGRELFRFWVKRETHDELPHVLRILLGAPAPDTDGDDFLEEFRIAIENPNKRSHLSREFRDVLLELLLENRPLQRSSAEDPKRRFAVLFQPPFLTELREELSRRANKTGKKDARALYLHSAADALGMMCSAESPIAPTRYFGLGLALDCYRLSWGTSKPKTLVRETLSLLDKVYRKVHGELTHSLLRHHVIPRETDPLHKMIYDLQIRRFATTNYDLEIERLAFDIGFRESQFEFDEGGETPDSIRVGSAGGRSRDLDLTEEATVDLLDFATDDARYALETIHLHGRATEESEILITERDYQVKYLRDSASQSTFREGLDVTFGGNPVLFVGLGMTEGDVLRPLREFVSTPSRRNRAIIALRDCQTERVKRDTFAMDQYARHGAHIIHYGFLTDERGNRNDPDTNEPSWVSRLVREIRNLQDHLRAACEALEQKDIDAFNKSLAKIRTERFRNAVKQGSKPEDFTSLYSDGGRLDIALEVSALETIAALSVACGSDVRHDGSRRMAGAYLREVAPSALERAKASILSLALNAKLEGLRSRWQQWWAEWQVVPEDRGLHMSYAIMQQDTEVSLWGRHITNSAESDRAARPPSFLYPNWLPPTRDDRRFMVLMAPKGYGKGYLFSFLATTLTISTEKKDKKKYLGQLFHSFSFATEVASVWDSLAVFLAAPRDFPTIADPKSFREALGIDLDEYLQMTRLERLDWALHELTKAKASRKTRNRALVAFNAADILFERDGTAKQPEIRQVFDLLLHQKHRSAPLDLIMSFRDVRVPDRLRSDAEQDGMERPHLYLLQPPEPKLYEKQYLADVLERADVRPVNFGGKDKSEGAGKYTNFLYILPEPKPEHFEPKGETGTDSISALLKDAMPHHVVAQSPDHPLAKFLKQYLGSNGYAFSLIRAIAAEAGRGRRPDSGRLPSGIGALRRLLEQIVLDAEATSFSPPSDHFYELIFDHWYQHGAPESTEVADSPDLHEALLRHIAVIATPVHAAVLAQCPLIIEHLERLGCQPDQNATTVGAALAKLYERHLIMKVEPHFRATADSGRRRDSTGADRYQVHRSIQTHMYRKLGSQSSEPSEGYLFAPSLYVAQTRALPRLHATSYKFLYELVDNLISYPPRQNNQLADASTARPPHLHALCLRAALGVVRTLFSLGIVTRFADVDILPIPRPPQIGYLEHHRLAIRWMLKLACWLDENVEGDRPRRDPEWPPFYRDEIVWLYNECGVFSLAQGQCFDARALFEQALKEQAKIDGRNNSAMRLRILANSALCAIDRGGLGYARRAFAEIKRSPVAEPLLKHLAIGFGAHLEHISGQVDKALTDFNSAIEGLEQLQRTRALAMLHCHRADLHRQRGDSRLALTDYERAVEQAQAGSYADLIHYASIGAVRTKLSQQPPTIAIQDAMKQLQAAEDYADRMDLPRLKFEVLFIRSEVQIHQGEMALAGQLITRAVRIANLNGLALRRISGLRLLAQIHHARGDVRGAERLEARTIQAAREIGYNLFGG